MASSAAATETASVGSVVILTSRPLNAASGLMPRRNMIGRDKSKTELDAEARAEALLKKAQSNFYSKAA
jgi:hypothetical protein